jgi:hypothetical protein
MDVVGRAAAIIASVGVLIVALLTGVERVTRRTR